ncbi:unnamed protein product [Rotaria socialis]|uniref:Transposase n=1 Tax=Rotaria socialis TaxID=392032 RepID=A0A820J9C6_9BILA|nr:unnamed protein product [Rotaria socialis]CAF3282740.1 unnamed protein product [Rotaria socialis]CAF4322185.1 unnamed protein product [Rotaria socialis]CAF4430965.1 unnamed protein product [Rotaria socialis]CAF4720536.1 unnamed protein product [Rotaria socialis]
MDNEYNRYYIKIRTILGINPKTIHEQLATALGPKAPSCPTVADFRASDENIELVRQVINNDPHSTYNDIIAETSLSRGTMEQIIHNYLKMKKVTSRWIPHQLNDEQKQERVRLCRENLAKFRDGSCRLCDIITGGETWIYHRQIHHKSTNKTWISEGESPRTIVRRRKFERKKLFSIFFKSNGPVLIHAVDSDETIAHDYYIENCLKPVVK